MKRGFGRWAVLLAILLASAGVFSVGNGAKAESAEAMEAYREFLSEDTILWVDGDPLFAGGVQFMTEDINGDGVPELIVHNREYPEFGRIGVFTYHGFVDGLGGGDELGFYYPETGVFTTTYIVTKTNGEVSKTQDVYLYLEDAAELSTATQIVKWRLQIGLHETLASGEERFYWQGIYEKDHQDEWAAGSTEQISKEAFETNLSALTGGVEGTQLVADWLNNNAENRNQYLK